MTWQRETAAVRDEHGAVAVLTAVLAIALFAVAAIVIDLGAARDVKRQSQNAADASALAGVNVLYPVTAQCKPPSTAQPPCVDDALAEVKRYAQANFNVASSSWATCSDPDGAAAGMVAVGGQTACIRFDSLTAPTKLRVKVPTRDVQGAFSGVTDVESIPIQTIARATLKPGQARSCGLCVLGTEISDLGNGDVTVTGGSVHLNGSANTGPNGHLTASPSGMSITATGTCTGNCTPAAEHAPLIPDPMATSLTLPPTMPSGYTTVKSDPCTQGPGIYKGLELPNSTCTIDPGLYVVTGPWTMKNSTMLRGTGVTLYFTCAQPDNKPRACNSPGEVGGGLDSKNGNADLTAPAVAPVSGALTGFVVIYDRMNRAGLNIQGNGATKFTGTIYAPQALLEFPGNSTVTVVNGPVVVGRLYGNGNTGGIDLVSAVGATIPTPPSGASLDQ